MEEVSKYKKFLVQNFKRIRKEIMKGREKVEKRRNGLY